jgi:protein-S-isoprenylcysteine O-methyltransferase Ste14
MPWLEKKVPPLLLAVALGLFTWWLSTTTPAVVLHSWVRWTLVVFFMLSGLVCCGTAVASFRKAGTTVDPRSPEKASTFVHTGIYKYSRNPMYVGFTLMILAWAVFLESPAGLVVAAGFVTYLNYFQIPPEERALRSRFGEDYIRYTEKVRRWI